jgi:hypothetical protein
MSGIDSWLPTFDVGERHEVALPVSPEQALTLALAVPAAPDGFVRLLFRLRGLRPSGSIEQFMAANGFTMLERTATTYVVGLVARSVRVVADFRAEPAPGGSRLITETRVAASGRLVLLGFRAYWLLVGPFSKLIRRRWLRAAVARTPQAATRAGAHVAA